MKPTIERELLEEMTLFPPQQNQGAAANRPAPVQQFSEEQLLEAAERNPWVKMNVMVPHMGAVRKNARVTNRQRIRGDKEKLMWIKLLQAHPVFYPSRSESVGSVHSIGDPKGRALIAAGVAEPTSQPLDPEQDDLERVRQKARERQGGRPLWDEPLDKPQAKRRDRSAALAAILKADKGRRSTLRRKRC